MRKMIIFIILLMHVIIINAEETQSEELVIDKEIPIDFLFNIDHTLTYNSDSDNPITNLKVNNLGFIGVQMLFDFYTFRPWSEIEIEKEWAWEEGNILDIFYGGIYLGIDNDFNILDYFTIRLAFEQKFKFYPTNEISFSSIPIFGLFGEYEESGISWEFTFPLSFDYSAVYDSEIQYDNVFKAITFDDVYIEFNFEFFHFFVSIPEEITSTLHLEDTLTVKMPITINIPEETKEITNEIEVGIVFDIYGFSPFTFLWINPENYILVYDQPDNQVFNFGFKTGIEYSIEYFTMGISYLGQRDVFLPSNESPFWENEVEFWFIFDLN